MENCCIKKEEPRRCKRCVMPETKGRVEIDENGLCNICREREKDNTKVEKKDEKESLSYFKKKLLFHTKSSPKYDCIVSVSGGKDSMMTLYIAKKGFGCLCR